MQSIVCLAYDHITPLSIHPDNIFPAIYVENPRHSFPSIPSPVGTRGRPTV
ncbi:hypothetical protein HanIR_Chr12g0563391 [Helianthus annuus]|nr:hypothetical protein HanIR_Chr12g0563391 [Helianthus annuus]